MNGTNYGVKQISLSISAMLTIVIVPILGLLSYKSESVSISIPIIAGCGIFIFLVAFGIISIYLEKFIFRKIKLIYKVINSSKLGGNPNLSDKDFYKSNSLYEVDKQVATWAKDTADELETLKSLENYRRTFLGNVSHELKTPLFSIQGYLLTLLEGAMYDEKVLHKYLKKAAKNADRLNSIITDLEYITSLETDGPPFDYKSFDIKALILEVIDDIPPQATVKNISFDFKTEDLLDNTVYADINSIRQVLSNLLINSIKYGKENGTTSIGLFDIDEDTMLIEVSDNGIGIEEKHHKHLFDRFFRVDKSRNRNIEGSGLGLSIVKHILEAHHQTVRVRSTPGVGSTFGFTLSKPNSDNEV